MISFIIGFIVGAMLMMCAIGMVAIQKDKKPQNKVRFYLVKTSFSIFDLFLGYPIKSFGSCGTYWTGNRIHINMKDGKISLYKDSDTPLKIIYKGIEKQFINCLTINK